MREEFFAKIGWTRSFISGPADPVHNPHMVWCHVCKKNFSIKTKGPFEILRHHRSERHLRRDQRWRNEHLRSVDPVTGKIQHRVRGRNGKLLTKIELAKELPKFIHAELVDLGERFPFYDDFIRGRTTPLITPESRARTQLNIVSDFLQTEGDLGTLRNLWARISSFTDHQAALCDFDWGEERVSVSNFPIGSHYPAQAKGFLILFSVQAIFQHLFNCAMSEIAEHVASEQCFGLEFEDDGANRFMSLRFWKKTELCRVLICRSGLPSAELTGELGSLARLLSVVSTKVDILACSGCPLDFIRTIDEMPSSTRSMQSCYRFEHLELRRLMHKTSYSVFGHIDFFSVLRGLVISLGGALTEDWMLGSPELTRVSRFYFT